MYGKILCPTDLSHLDALAKALEVTGQTARAFGAKVVYVAIAPAAPGAVSHSPAEYDKKMQALASEQAEKHGIETSALTLDAVDPTAAVDHLLEKAVSEQKPDLIVMATHSPKLADHIWSGHGLSLARDTDASVFLVRD